MCFVTGLVCFPVTLWFFVWLPPGGIVHPGHWVSGQWLFPAEQAAVCGTSVPMHSSVDGLLNCFQFGGSNAAQNIRAQNMGIALLFQVNNIFHKYLGGEQLGPMISVHLTSWGAAVPSPEELYVSVPAGGGTCRSSRTRLQFSSPHRCRWQQCSPMSPFLEGPPRL